MKNPGGMNTRSKTKAKEPPDPEPQHSPSPSRGTLLMYSPMVPAEEIKWLMLAIDGWLADNEHNRQTLTATEQSFIDCFHGEFRVNGYLANIDTLRNFVSNTKMHGIEVTPTGELVYQQHDLLPIPSTPKPPPMSPNTHPVPDQTFPVPTEDVDAKPQGNTEKKTGTQDPTVIVPDTDNSATTRRALNFEEPSFENNHWTQVTRKSSKRKKTSNTPKKKPAPPSMSQPPSTAATLDLPPPLEIVDDEPPSAPVVFAYGDTIVPPAVKPAAQPAVEVLKPAAQQTAYAPTAQNTTGTPRDQSVIAPTVEIQTHDASRMTDNRTELHDTQHWSDVDSPKHTTLAEATGILAADPTAADEQPQPKTPRIISTQDFMKTEEYKEMVYELSIQMKRELRQDMRASITSQSPQWFTAQWHRIKEELADTKRSYDAYFERGHEVLSQREAALETQQRRLTASLRPVKEHANQLDAALEKLTTNYKARLKTHVAEMYLNHTETWDTHYRAQTEEAQTNYLERQQETTQLYEQQLEQLRTQHDLSRIADTLPGQLITMRNSLQELQKQVTEQIQAQAAAYTAQTKLQAEQTDANTGSLAFQYDEFSEQIAAKAQAATSEASKTLSAWLDVEKGQAVAKVRKHVQEQLAEAVESNRAILQSDLDSIEPLAREMMTRTLQDFKKQIEHIKHQRTPVQVETIDENTDEPIATETGPAQPWIPVHRTHKQRPTETTHLVSPPPSRWKVQPHIRAALETGQSIHSSSDLDGLKPHSDTPGSHNPYASHPEHPRRKQSGYQEHGYDRGTQLPRQSPRDYRSTSHYRDDDSAYAKEKKLSSFRKAAIPTMINAVDAQGTKKEYCAFHYFCETYDVPLVDWDSIHADIVTLYPVTSSAAEYHQYTKLIYQKLEEDSSMDLRGNPLLAGLMAQHNGTRDGYAVLREITRRFANKENKADSAIRNTQPIFDSGDIFAYAGELTSYYEYQATQHRTWEPIEKTTLFLEAIKHDDDYGKYAQDILRTLDQRTKSTPLEVGYELASLPTTLLRNKDHSEKGATNPFSINKMRGSRGDGRGEGRGEYGRSKDDGPRRGYDRSDGPRGERRRDRGEKKDMRKQPRERRKPCQCDACGLFGHEAATCTFFPRLQWALQYGKTHPEYAKQRALEYKRDNHPDTRQQTPKRKMMNQLRSYLDQSQAEEMTDKLCEHVMAINKMWMEETHQESDSESEDGYEYDTDDDEQRKTATFNRMQIYTPTEIEENRASIHSMLLPTEEVIRTSMKEEQRRSTLAPPTIAPELSSLGPFDPRSHKRVIKRLLRFDPRTGKLADGGANCSATSELSLIHDYKPGSNYWIKDCHGQEKQAEGEGYLFMVDNTGKIDRHFVIYDPEVEGTIISPEHHTLTNPDIHRWVQESVPSEHGGQILYYNKAGELISSYDTVRHDGLYYMTDTSMLKPSDLKTMKTLRSNAVSSSTATTSVVEDPATTFIDGDHYMDLSTEDLDVDLSEVDLDDWQHAMTITPTEVIDEPIMCHVCNVKTAHTLTPTEEALLEYEKWHQRLGHVGKKKIQQTAPWTTGIPDIDVDKIIPKDIPHCRSCAKGKMQKANKGSNKDHSHLKPRQQFQMDIGFMRGPSNLADVVERNAKAKTRVIKSRQGFTCYLLIVDAKSRYIWVFLLKSKHPPLKLMDKFLATHGRHDNTVRTIRTDGDGALANSSDFRVMCLHKHGYIVETTGPDSSSMNGLAEIPHKTLARMVRCMLFAALLGVEYWADALVYAAYIYVRLFHSTIETTPYYALTGTKAKGEHLRTWGSYVTVKRPGPRNLKLDPNHYDGRFMRFGATEKNIVYTDLVTNKDKVARHLSMDEFHYGSDARPPGAKAVMDIISPNGVIGGSTLKETELLVSDNGQPHKDPTFFGSEMMDDTMPPIPPQPPPTAPTIAAAAKMQVSDERILHMEPSLNMFGDPIPVTVNLRERNPHPLLGFQFRTDPITQRLYLETCHPKTTASKIPRWRSRFRFANLQTVDGNQIQSVEHLTDFIATSKKKGIQSLRFVFAKLESRHAADDGVPQLHLDQLRIIRRMQVEQRLAEAQCRLQRDHITLDQQESADNADTKRSNLRKLRKLRKCQARGQTLSDDDQDYIDQVSQKRFSRSQLRKRKDFKLWQQADFAQHDKYRKQDMFGDPIPRPKGATVLRWVWQRHWKENATADEKGEYMRKARATCDGGQKYGKAVTLAETYATCIEQPICRIFWALTAVLGLVAYGADAGNAFAEAPPPVSPFYMEVDEAYQEYWTQHLGNPPIPDGYVLPVKHALQGHPESPRLWEKHITQILTDLGYTATTHERCLYYKTTDDGKLILIIRQVDDFAVASTDTALCKSEISKIGEELLVPLNHLGLIKKFNGVDILQTRDYVKVSCESYINKIIEHHGWNDLPAANKPIPMRSDPKYVAMLETADTPTTDKERKDIEKQMGFSYRSIVGELVFAMVIARADLSYCITKLSQWNKNPAKCHYQAGKQVYAYLNATKHEGLTYWREQPREDLPFVEHPSPCTNEADILPQLSTEPTRMMAMTDSDWGSDRATRRSVSGMIIMLAGAAVIYKTGFQKSIALSSTEAEFIAGSDTGKATLYLRSILHELGLTQHQPTQIYQDNHGAIHMANAQAPTRRTRHVELRHFALLQWVENQEVTLVPIGTDYNHSDAMTKALGRTKFHQHADIYMGKVPPTYVSDPSQTTKKVHKLSANTNCVVLAAFDPEI